MRRSTFLASAAGLGLAGAMAAFLAAGGLTAQEAPQSILPPGFDDPAPAPTPAPAPRPNPAQGPSAPSSGSGSAPASSGASAPSAGDGDVPRASASDLSRIPTAEQLEAMSIDELDDFLGLKQRFDIPPAARRAMTQVGVLSMEEGGLPTGSLKNQPAKLVRAVLAGTKGPMVSRWGHIMLRRALTSRMAAPEGMAPAEFAALRVGVLNRIGEYTAASRLAQDVDTNNWNKGLTTQALRAYLGAGDVTGACPVLQLRGSTREDPQWVLWRGICNAYAGEAALAGSQLDQAAAKKIAPAIDVSLAQRYAGGAGRSRRGANVEWDDVEKLTPWRFSLSYAVGEEIPAGLTEDLPRNFHWSGAVSPLVPISERVRYADVAASAGILSSRAMVDLYSEIYGQESITGEYAQRAGRLRNAYVASDPAARVAAMRGLWGTLDGEVETPVYAASVMTAYAAARITPSEQFADYAGEIIASMLTAGLDRDAASWAGSVEPGSLGWALLALANPKAGTANTDALDAFIDDDGSEDYRKSAFLVAGLAGLGRISEGQFGSYASDLDFDPARQTRWTRVIAKAAAVENRGLVALLAGLGMQGNDWKQMTPLYLYHITKALKDVGLEAEARMIAAEAVARG
jgi:hypothetical protein